MNVRRAACSRLARTLRHTLHRGSWTMKSNQYHLQNQWKENQTKNDKMKTPPHKTICRQSKWDVLSNWDLIAV